MPLTFGVGAPRNDLGSGLVDPVKALSRWDRSRRNTIWVPYLDRFDFLTSCFSTGMFRGTRASYLAEPAVTLVPMTKGREVVEDYKSQGSRYAAIPSLSFATS
jgi:hypothetical protein